MCRFRFPCLLLLCVALACVDGYSTFGCFVALSLSVACHSVVCFISYSVGDIVAFPATLSVVALSATLLVGSLFARFVGYSVASLNR
jgi:hypothetical protein